MEGCVLHKKKTVLKSVNKTEELLGMSKSKREKNQNKNHPNRFIVAKILQNQFCSAKSYLWHPKTNTLDRSGHFRIAKSGTLDA